ncbi:MAG: hypothetical protein DMF73_18810 [Acidobacteria bacterium]|nr:MAG: hypothetical protein DMF73_18810 [Acidobacteriota bacterium]
MGGFCTDFFVFVSQPSQSLPAWHGIVIAMTKIVRTNLSFIRFDLSFNHQGHFLQMDSVFVFVRGLILARKLVSE